MEVKPIWLLKDYEGDVCCAFDEEGEAQHEKACANDYKDGEFTVEKTQLYTNY
tara:strand:- start:286 stop:444 length:159 start_codon:yes stop_codon:yes gene_type:complete